MRLNKSKISSLLFYVAFFLISFKTILYFSNLNLVPIPRDYLKYVSIGVIGLLFIKCLIDSYKNYEKMIIYLLTFVVLGVLAIYTNTTTISVLLAFLLSIKPNINIRTIAKIHLAVFVPSLLIHVVMGELQYNGVVDFETILDIESNSSRGLYYFYCYYNTAASLCLGAVFSLIFLANDRNKLKISYLMLPLIGIIYYVTTSRTFVVFYLGYLIAYTLSKVDVISKIFKFCSRYAVPVLSVISLLFIRLKDTLIVQKIDEFLTYRINCAVVANNAYGMHFWPKKSVINEFFNSDYVLDNVYLRYIILYGLVSVILLSVVFFITTKRVSRFTACLFLSLAVAGISENYTFDIAVTLIPMLVFHDYKKYKEVRKLPQDKKVSIIVPNYNGEKYIKRCLKTLIKQTYENIEIIVIDDGSNDRSREIIRKLAKKDKRIIFVENDNHGVSYTRNLGLARASGDYITFIDSDDYVEYSTYFELMKLVNKYDLDIVKFGFYRSYKIVNRKYKFSNDTNKVLNVKDVKSVLTSNDCCNVWNALIKSDIAKSVSFDSNVKMGEDYLYFTNCLAKAKNIYFTNESYYYYCFNTNSFTLNLNKDKVKKIMEDTINVNNKIVDLGLANKEDVEIRNNYVASENLEKVIIISDYKEYQEYINMLKTWDLEYNCSLNNYRKNKIKNKIKRFIIRCM